jgi:xylose isomerase
MSEGKISVGVWAYGSCSDRYVSEGYREKPTLAERIRRIGEAEGVGGVEVTYPGDVNEDSYEEFALLLEKHNLRIAAIGVELVCDKEWQTGSFTSVDAGVRRKALDLVTAAMDFAAAHRIKVVNLWLGQDGHDYFFQADYVKQWDYLVAGLRECGRHNPEVLLGLEYKMSEPRLHCLLGSGGVALAAAMATGEKNVGVTMDVGHALNARENIAETAAILLRQNRLFHLHLNDNYIIADDDMPVGSVHVIHFLELLYWLKKLGYEGWYSLDMYPYRDSPDSAVAASVTFLRQAGAFLREKWQDFDLDKALASPPSAILRQFYNRVFCL